MGCQNSLKPSLEINRQNLDFNPNPPFIMHIDLNSCFATIEQQANPFLRGRPIAVAAYDSPLGCIIAPSIEAKKMGIKVGMRVKDGKKIYPNLIVLSPDPWKYRNIHLALRQLISGYTDDFSPKSIDEFVLNMENYLNLPHALKDRPCKLAAQSMRQVALEIKKRIKKEIGEWITVSIGIAPNRFLAKLASSLHKPDGLDEINKNNFFDIYAKLSLTDLCGIKERNALRLNLSEIFSVLDFYHASLAQLKSAFKSINAYYWFLRLRGWEIDDFVSSRKSYGNSFALPKPLKTIEELLPILSKLVEKMSFRLRKAGYKAQGVHLVIFYRDWSFWHKGVKTARILFDTRDIYKETVRLLKTCPYQKPVRELMVSVFNLIKNKSYQLEFFEDVLKKKRLVDSIDQVNHRWGDFVVAPARILDAKNLVPDRIAFGGIKELEEFTLSNLTTLT